jgi:predicted small lipoprotein YifL
LALVTLAVLVALGAALAGCGSSGTRHVPDLAKLPLVPGTEIVARARQCDKGNHPYCAIEIVLVGRSYKTSQDLLGVERERLVSLGWTREGADAGNEHAADSPGHRLRVTYATALTDLTGIELGWIKRARPIAPALSRAVFQRTPALSMMLELSTSES